MSVIYGLVNLTDKNIDSATLALMESGLNHWNADDKGSRTYKHAGLGHLMFYNTPESLIEKLPLQQGNLTITADARIDNRYEIYTLLNLKTAEEKAAPDSTLILALYEKFGDGCVKHLVGDFAFAIWDEQQQQLFCARDHIGIKPFFYYHDENIFAFASEIKGILVLPGIDKSYNLQFLYNQMFRNSEQKLDATIYKHIHRVAPAHYVVLKNKQVQTNRYWKLDADFETKFETRQEYYDAFRMHFENAVKCRLRTAYPIGVELSGGMDSSGITGVASHFLKQEGRSLIAISNTIPRDVYDEEKLKKSEREFIDAVVDFNGIENSIITVANPPGNLFEDTDFMLEVNDGLDPWQQQWQIPIRQSAQKEGIRTLLSGFPGDEMVTYRGKYYFLDYLDKKQYFKYFFAKKKFPGFSKLDPFVPHKLRYAIHTFKNKLGWYNKHARDTLKMFNIPAKNVHAKGDIAWLDPLLVNQFKSYRHYQKQRFLRYHLPARMESETRYGLYFNLEPRFPMADIRLVQYYLSMPNDIKYEGTLHRTAYRKAMERYMPKAVLERDNKFGGMGPYHPPVEDKELVKARIEENQQQRQQLLDDLKDNPFIKKAAIKKKLVNLAVFRWLQKHPDCKPE